MAQYHAKVIPMLVVPNTAFFPRPKVTSAVVRLVPRVLDDEQRALAPFLNTVTVTAFSARRKTLRNALSKLFSPEQIEALGIKLTDRAENLSVDAYVKLAAVLKARKETE